MIAEIKNELGNLVPTKKQIMVFGGIIVFLCYLIAWKLYGLGDSFYPTLGSVIFITSVIVVDWKILIPLYRLWMLFAMILGWFVLRLLLILLYVVVIVPLGAILQLFGKGEMRLPIDKQASTYWARMSHHTDRARYLKKF